VKNNQYDFTKKLLINAYINCVIENENKLTPHILTENEVRKLSDEELDKYCSDMIKKIVESYLEAEEYQ